MFDRWNTRIVESLVESLWWNPAGDAPPGGDEVRRTSAFIVAQRRRMPDYLRLPMFVLTLLCDLLPLCSRFHGRFHRLPLAERRQLIGRWRSGRLGVRRDFVRFYESLVVFGGLADRDERSEGMAAS